MENFRRNVGLGVDWLGKLSLPNDGGKCSHRFRGCTRWMLASGIGAPHASPRQCVSLTASIVPTHIPLAKRVPIFQGATPYKISNSLIVAPTFPTRNVAGGHSTHAPACQVPCLPWKVCLHLGEAELKPQSIAQQCLYQAKYI